MHLLVISLLTILAGTLLLAKTRKEALGKFFAYISWFFIVVGFLLFLGAIAGGIFRMRHHCMPIQQGWHHGYMMKECPNQMMKGRCCSPDAFKQADSVNVTVKAK